MTYTEDLFRELAERGEHRDPGQVIDEVLDAVADSSQAVRLGGSHNDIAPMPLRRVRDSSATDTRSRWWAAAAAAVVVVAAGVGVSQLDSSSDVAVTGQSDDMAGPETPTIRRFGEPPDVSGMAPLWPADLDAASAPRDPDVAVQRFAREVLGTEPSAIDVTGSNDDDTRRWVTLTTDGGAVANLVVDRHTSGAWSVDFERTTIGGSSNDYGETWSVDFPAQPDAGVGELVVVRLDSIEVVELTTAQLRDGSLMVEDDYQAGILIVRNDSGEVTFIGLAGWPSNPPLVRVPEPDEPTLVNDLAGWEIEDYGNRVPSLRDQGTHYYLTHPDGVAVLSLYEDAIRSEQVDEVFNGVPLTVGEAREQGRLSVTAPLGEGTVQFLSVGINREQGIAAVKEVLSAGGEPVVPLNFTLSAESGTGMEPLQQTWWRVSDGGDTEHVLGRMSTPTPTDVERMVIDTRVAGGQLINETPAVWFTPGLEPDGPGTLTWTTEGARWGITNVQIAGDDWRRFVDGVRE